MQRPIGSGGTGGYTVESHRGGLTLAPDVSETVVRRHYLCAAVGSNETKRLIRTKKGLRVISVTIRQGVPAAGGSTAVWTVGDAATNNGFIVSTSAALAAGVMTDCSGAYVTGRAGKLYTNIDDVNLYYTAGGAAGATAPSCDIRLVVQQEWPEV